MECGIQPSSRHGGDPRSKLPAIFKVVLGGERYDLRRIQCVLPGALRDHLRGPVGWVACLESRRQGLCDRERAGLSRKQEIVSACLLVSIVVAAVATGTSLWDQFAYASLAHAAPGVRPSAIAVPTES